MKIKICGLKDPHNIKEVAAIAPDYMGFICYDLSPRFIADMPADVMDTLPGTIYKTAVFVNENAEKIDLLINTFGFNAIQLHGDESPEFCKALKDKVTILKAFGLDEDFDFDKITPYAGCVDFFIFDTKTETHGGSGKTFNWDILDQYKLNVPFFLSGGLSLDNLADVKKIKHPQFYGVDLNSRFETAPGMKDINKIKKAFNILRQSD